MELSSPRVAGIKTFLFLLLIHSSWSLARVRPRETRGLIKRATRRTTTTLAPTTTTYIPTPSTIPPSTLRTTQEVQRAMERHEIIPDMYIKPVKNIKPLMVHFEEDAYADLGNHLSVRHIEYYAPLIQWPANETDLYTMIMVELDMPTRENATQREWAHWIMGNIPGCWVMRGDQIVEYQEPEPEEDSGSHRYVIVVYRQKQGKVHFREFHFDLLPKMLPEEAKRQKFRTRFFADDYKLGDPVYINFFESHWEKEKKFIPKVEGEDDIPDYVPNVTEPILTSTIEMETTKKTKSSKSTKSKKSTKKSK